MTHNLSRKLEAILFLHGDPVPLSQIAAWLEVDVDQVLAIGQELDQVLESHHSALWVQVAGDAMALATVAELDAWVRDRITIKTTEPMSHAAWEVLSIVAYKQPVTRLEIEAVRQVGSERAIETLVMRGLIEEIGRKDTPGRPILYGTTHSFLREFGLTDLSQLPSLDNSPNFPSIK
ncbi:MAG: SMC-Scp complex subunit ScpB [Firmicutes bacterium]|jgi:segregation and condensation protein B|nr:SMC-Scp complex subunit ScpB [Bacillota bacterium]MCL5971712.1 SMC-Scp complex subunit ScpB [Bacillota bacterium]